MSLILLFHVDTVIWQIKQIEVEIEEVENATKFSLLQKNYSVLTSFTNDIKLNDRKFVFFSFLFLYYTHFLL